MLCLSSSGDKGTAGAGIDELSRLGKCRDRPRENSSGRRRAFGVIGRELSSLLPGRRSWKVGEGAKVERALGGSEKERLFGVCDDVIVSLGDMPPFGEACIISASSNQPDGAV